MAFQLTLPLAAFLRSQTGQQWLQQAESLPLTAASMLADLQTLRQDLIPDQAAAVVEQVLLRRRGQEKFPQAAKMLFIRDALEQATHHLVSEHRANRFQQLSRVADLGCGLGGDSLALAGAAPQVIGLDADIVRLTLAQHNASVCGLNHKLAFLQADMTVYPFALNHVDAVFVDPARRTAQGQRIFNPHQYQPALSTVIAAFANRPLGIKVAPGLDPSLVSQVSEVELISLNGEAKEAVLWFNDLASPGVSRRATVLPGATSLTNQDPADCPTAPLSEYLYEPDPAIIRASLVQQAGTRLNLHLLDAHIAYLGGDQELSSPFVVGYRIEAKLPLKIKQINQYLKAHRIARINVKQRGTGLTPEAVSKQLKPAKTGQERTLILLRIQEDHWALICQRL